MAHDSKASTKSRSFINELQDNNEHGEKQRWRELPGNRVMRERDAEYREQSRAADAPYPRKAKCRSGGDLRACEQAHETRAAHGSDGEDEQRDARDHANGVADAAAHLLRRAVRLAGLAST